MGAHCMATNANADPVTVEPVYSKPVSARTWDGMESAWVNVARAAAPWPLFWLALPTISDGTQASGVLHGPLGLSAILTAMVAILNRHHPRRLARFAASVLGTGVMGELLVNAALSADQPGFASLEALPRALATWAICFAIYEVAPMVGASSRLIATEARHRGVDLVAHAAFAVCALLAYRSAPVHAELWMMSPWVAAMIAMPFAAARCVAPRPLPLSERAGPSLAPVALAIMAWLSVVALAVHQHVYFERALWNARWGLAPDVGVLVTVLALSIVCSIGATLWFVTRAWQAGRAPSGVVGHSADHGATLEGAGGRAPMGLVVEEGPQPEVGATVTVLGGQLVPPDAGPFRDGVVAWRARRVWLGSPEALARQLIQRAGFWALWAAAGGFALLFAIHRDF